MTAFECFALSALFSLGYEATRRRTGVPSWDVLIPLGFFVAGMWKTTVLILSPVAPVDLSSLCWTPT